MELAKHRFCGERLEELRKDKHMTQKQLAELLGVNEKTISSYERNEIAPKISKLIKISEIFDITPDYLLGFVNDEIPYSRRFYIPFSRDYPEEMEKELLAYLDYLKHKYNQI